MKKCISVMFVTFYLTGTLFGTALAGETSHYVNGGEGIKCATLPPPGVYWLAYNIFYNADKYMGEDGDKLDVDFDLSIYALVNRLVWVTPVKIVGADYVVDVIIPVLYTDIKIGALGVDDNEFGFGDIAIEPFVLSWHGSRHDAAFGLAVYCPTGKYDVDGPASPGKDFWTGMVTLGGTYYFDTEKTWSASILARYEVNSEKGEIDVRPGNDFHFEWGIGKTLAKVWDIGVTGYCHWQVTDDSGSDVTWDKSVHDRVFAVGPEVSVFFPSGKFAIALRSQWEFGAEDRSEGNVTTLRLIKIF